MITCDECTGRCCRRIVIEIDKPDTEDDYLDIFWYIFHPLLSVYIDGDDGWCVQVPSACKFLSGDGKCKIYEDRPPICRTSKVEDCDLNKPEVKAAFPNGKAYADWLIKNKVIPKEKIPEAYYAGHTHPHHV